MQDFAGERFKLADAKIFLAELNVVDAGSGGFADCAQKLSPALGFVPAN